MKAGIGLREPLPGLVGKNRVPAKLRAPCQFCRYEDGTTNMKTTINLLAAGMSLASFANAFGQPTITSQPTDLSVSLAANVTFQVTTSSAALLSYQWRFGALDLLSATNRSLSLTNVQLINAGDYAVVV